MRTLTLIVAAACAVAAEDADAAAAMRGGDLPRAEALLDGWLARHPADADARSRRATVRGWRGSHAAAIDDWLAVLAQRPDDHDALIGLARVHWWSGDPAAAREALTRLDPSHPEVRELAQRLDASGSAEKTWRIDLSRSWERWSADRPDDGLTTIAVGRRGAGWHASAALERWDRTGTVDWLLRTEAGAEVLPQLDLALVVGHADHMPAIAPDWILGVHALAGPWGRVRGLLDLDHYRYIGERSQVSVLAPGTAIDLGGGWSTELRMRRSYARASGDGQAVATEETNAWQVRVAWEGPRITPYLAHAQGREPDPPQPTRRVSAWWGGITVEVTEALALRVDTGLERAGDGASKRTAAAGITVRW